MIKQSLAIMALLAFAGCASQNGGMASGPTQTPVQPQAGMQEQVGPVQAELAAYAGSHNYPTSQPTENNLRAAALVNSDQGMVKIYNFGPQPIRDADIWVNKAFVRHVTVIAPGTSVSLEFSNLYNSVGQQFSTRGEHVNSVQVEQGHQLENVMGPVTQ
jgi:hypothetical protein